MLRDDNSDYKWFYACTDESAENAASAIINLSAAFGFPCGLISYSPTHFKNKNVRQVTKDLKVPHHFTLLYCPWSNGAVENFGEELVHVARAILTELQLRPEE